MLENHDTSVCFSSAERSKVLRPQQYHQYLKHLILLQLNPPKNIQTVDYR